MTIELLIKFIFVYYIALHGCYLMLMFLGVTLHRRYHQGINFGDFRRISESPLTLPVSIVIPAFNEELMIEETLLGALQLRYPEFEVIVVNDGSGDRTLDILIERFKLRRIDKVFNKHFETKPVRGFYESREYPNLIVVDKENGKRADSINAGIDLARYPLVLIIDADCILENDALIRMVRPFLSDSRTIAAAGIVRPANGLKIEGGRILEYGLPRRWLPLFQVVEYLRSFQWSRLGLSRLRSMLCMAGAFTMVRREVLLEIGGMDTKAITDDFEVTVALNRYAWEHKDARGPLKIAYVPDPVCYSEVPERISIHASQRNRWQRGVLQSLFRNWRMTFNPRYGMTGMFGMPFFLLFEGFSGLVEGLSWILIPVVYFLGIATLKELVFFLVFAVILGTFLSLGAVLLEERTRLRQVRTKDLIRLLLAGLLENFGYHQMHLLWRVAGTFDLLVRHRTDFGKQERLGFQEDA